VTDQSATSFNDENDRQALLAIYQAGKPDMMFQTRAPSSVSLEKMLLVMSDAKARDSYSTGVAGGLNKSADFIHQERKYAQPSGHRYMAGRDVSDDDKPVKVKVECPPQSDTVFSFRVQSKAA